MSEFLRAVAPTCYGVHVCLHKDVVQCVINRLLSCPCDVVFVSGALRWVAAKKVTTPPSPKGQQPASRHTRHLLPTSRAPAQQRSRTFRPILFAFRGSRRQWAVRPHTRVSCLLKVPAGNPTSAGRSKALHSPGEDQLKWASHRSDPFLPCIKKNRN